ncbi:MAG: cation transporter [Deltaproteobacteria bacterium]|nr:cation transporter [Deltaproteobacteria bacterium]
MEVYRKALYLEYVTVGYNVLEGIFSIAAGYRAGSIALVGFGFDSAVESISGGIIIWRLARHGRISKEEEERVESRATKFVGISFFLLGAYVLFESIKKLYFLEEPLPTLFGIVIAISSIVTMPALSYSKYKTAKKMGSKSLEADSKETLVCALLSIALVVGLGLNYLYGIWWADPVAALVIVFFIVKEGIAITWGEEE